MFSSDELPGLDRRSLLRNAIMLVGGGLAATPGGAIAKAVTKPKKKPARFFSPAQMVVLATVTDIIIPRTDTPGAKDAGVPQNFDALMRNWASAQHQAQFNALVDELGGLGLAKLPAGQRIEAVRKFDADKLAVFDETYVKFKELVLTLYYLSEAGATKELRYELIPGKWEPWTEMAPDARAWAV
ncbi:MAG: gluconate 2-dehydrogenase subunit 3 family protein [Sphingomicrobium sp.]